MGFVKNCGNRIIIYINVLFGLIGLVCFAGGLFVKYGSNQLKPLLGNLMTEIEKKIEPLTKEIGISSADFTEKLDLEKLIGDAAVVFIVFGAIVLFVVICGCCGSCMKIRWLLILYCVILILVLLGQIFMAVVILDKREIIDEKIKQPMRKSLKEYYRGDDALDVISIAWNALMVKLSCCGVDNVDDLSGGKWNRRPGSASTFLPTTDLDSPLVCCKESERDDIKNKWSCACQPFVKSESNYDKGCYDAIWEYLDQYRNIVIGVVSGLAGLEVLLIFFSIYVAKDMNKDGKVSPNDRA